MTTPSYRVSAQQMRSGYQRTSPPPSKTNIDQRLVGHWQDDAHHKINLYLESNGNYTYNDAIEGNWAADADRIYFDEKQST
ncbi:MAG TPA: hypothetical protein VH437_19550 [Terriglobales bacterium]